MLPTCLCPCNTLLHTTTVTVSRLLLDFMCIALVLCLACIAPGYTGVGWGSAAGAAINGNIADSQLSMGC